MARNVISKPNLYRAILNEVPDQINRLAAIALKKDIFPFGRKYFGRSTPSKPPSKQSYFKFALRALSARTNGDLFLNVYSLAFCLWSCIAVLVLPAQSYGQNAPVNTGSVTQSVESNQQQGNPQSANRFHNRLSLQPVADRMRRRLGQRFQSPGREVSVMLGTLTIGTERHTVRIIRKQDLDSEQVDILLSGGGQPPLSWNSKEGAKVAGNAAAGSHRSLIERLVLDSPDQFILAQIRGAAYRIIARNVRPAEAGDSDDYTGPIWDLVRIGEPGDSDHKQPQSQWRIYYINVSTGLIEKVVSEEQGETIVAELSGWASQDGEMVPTRIVWSRNNQVIMELSLNNIGHGPKQ
ncbi:MAG TPA: hypothetical protein IGS52_22500 [Oscillatoriaceae cyanobacterium M33_DOE_052]|nr:hypothetical protein [Oscillatoriaceae cyanobacterium M33_DOE_052]